MVQAEPSGPHEFHGAELTPREALLFEAGVKLGGIFHQYLGIPVSERTAAGLARSIENAVALQPYVHRVKVRIEPGRGGAVGRGRFGYRYLTPEMLRVRIDLRQGTTTVNASLEFRPDLHYTLMRVDKASTRKRAPRRSGGARARRP